MNINNSKRIVIWAYGSTDMSKCSFIVEAACPECGRKNTSEKLTFEPMRILSIKCSDCGNVPAKIHIEKYQIFTESFYCSNIVDLREIEIYE